jgi:hypothetical protein
MIFAGVAYANFGPHGNYIADTDACAGCHRAHTAASTIRWTESDGSDTRSALLATTATYMTQFCYTCHGDLAPGASTNVQAGIFDNGPTSPDNSQYAVQYGATEPTPDIYISQSMLDGVLNGGGFDRLGGSSTFTAAKWGVWDNPNTSTEENYVVEGTGENATSRHAVQGYSGASGSVTAFGSTYTDGSGNIVWGPGKTWNVGTSNVTENGQAIFACDACHDPHGSSNYRILKDYVNGYTVGGYSDGATTVDPNPDPWVVSIEKGYPNGQNGKDLGFRLHKPYDDYKPDYTVARYAKAGAAWKGISGWCIACHDQYITKVGTSELDTDGSGFTGINASGEYNAGDGIGSATRHRHPMNVPLTNFYVNGQEANGPVGDRALIYDPGTWMATYRTADKYEKKDDPGNETLDEFVDIPLEHSWTEDEPSDDTDTPEYDVDDNLGCLTCHRAHGTSASMEGYAIAGYETLTVTVGSDTQSIQVPAKTSTNSAYNTGQPQGDGVPPANTSALLRADNRGVCERCHNK